MKKLLFLLLCVVFASCSEMTDFVNSREVKKKELSLVFEGLNDSLMLVPHRGNFVSTRGFWDQFKRAVALAGADFAGACGGIYATKEAALALGGATGGTGAVVVMGVAGVLCGASASILAADDLNSRISIDENCDLTATTTQVYTASTKDVTVDYVQLDFPPEYDYVNVLGGMHNVIVQEVCKVAQTDVAIVANNTDPSVEPPTDPGTGGEGGPTITDGTETGVATASTTLATSIPIMGDGQYQQMETLVLESSDYVNISDNLLNNISNACFNGTFNVNSFLNNNSGLSAQTESIVTEYYSQLLNEYTESMEDVIAVANAYISKIASMSSLTKDEKENLYLMIAVSVNSINYWRINL